MWYFSPPHFKSAIDTSRSQRDPWVPGSNFQLPFSFTPQEQLSPWIWTLPYTILRLRMQKKSRRMNPNILSVASWLRSAMLTY